MKAVAWLALAMVALGTTSCAQTPGHARRPSDVRFAACTRLPTLAASVLSGPPDVVAADVAQSLFACAPVIVIANAGRPASLTIAVTDAERADAPLLLSGARGLISPALQAAIDVLRPRTVLAVGMAGREVSAQLGRVHVVTTPALLPKTRPPVALRHVVLLLRQGGGGVAGTTAAVITAQLAGALPIAVHAYDPRADPAAIAALASARPRYVLAIGRRFEPARRLRYRVAVAATGVQLPGGGQVLFPMRRLVALYGHPGTPGLGALGQQSLSASITRVRKLAGRFRALSAVPVVPAFEIIATVAQGAKAPGPDGSYSYQTPVATLLPWVRRASIAGVYVVLDLQPGRASLLGQAKAYASLLRLPNVGLALDPEWKLRPRQLPLRQIGSVSAAEINSVITWLADLTARHHLPQKLLVLHQFRLSMIGAEHAIDTRHDDIAIVIHMDGQGTPSEKQQTWDSVIHAAPHGVFFGWKNFFVKDHPMLGPPQTMARTPEPVMISYQ
jgi:hypothetical protein